MTSEAMDSLHPGRNLHPRFKLVRRLAAKGPSGARGPEQPGEQAWLVRDEELDELLVAKIVPPGTPAARIALLKQACKSARKLVHPNLVPIYDFHRGDQVSFVTMAPVAGRDLDELESPSLDEILRVMIPVADALEYTHRHGVVHGDLRPSCIFLDETGVPRIADVAVAAYLSRRESAGEASVASDVRAFGTVLFRLVTGREHRDAKGYLSASVPVPESLRDVLSLILAPVEHGRLPTMAQVREKLHLRETESAPRRTKVTPPPIVREVRPIRPESGSASPGSVARRGGGLGPKTIAAFVLLVGTALAVVVVLPRWVQQRGTTPFPSASRSTSVPGATATMAEAETPDLRALAEEKTKAEEARVRASRLRDGLESRSVGRWGGSDYAAAADRLESGERKLVERDYSGALAELEVAARSFEALESRAKTVLSETLAKAKQALAGGRSAEATDLFQLALAAAPDDREAASGLERAKHLDELLSILASGEELETRGDLEGAAQRYRRAVSLDPLSTAAQKALSRVDAKASDEAFGAAMTAALAALGRKDYEAARAAFERARAIRPEAPEIASGLAQVAEGARVQAIAGHRDRARALETVEDWHAAAAEYEKALALDPALRFAQEGKARAAARALLEDKLNFQIAHPERLSDENALKEAAGLLDEARSVEPAGEKHRAKVSALEALVDSSARPVEVQILSDRLTEVTIYRIGRLGKFDRRALELRPGRYTVVGTRDGYRDVRHEVVVEAGKAPQPVLVRCEEKI